MNNNILNKRVALVGNMNNNNFSLLRYLRSLGVDTDLYLNQNDCSGESSHFAPESDTWELEKWNNYIFQSKLSEDPISAFNFPLSTLFFIKSLVKKIFNKNEQILLPVSKKYIKKTFAKYDYIIGSGITPAIFDRCDIKISLFIPYAIGVEWFCDPVFNEKFNSKNMIIKLFASKIKQKQINGLKKVKQVICADNFTKSSLKAIDLFPTTMTSPMVYNLNPSVLKINNYFINNTLLKIENSDFVVLSHVRHYWKRPNNISELEWIRQDKNNDWLINSFSSLINDKKIKNPLLILFEYGKDVSESKKLIKIKNIEKYIIWLPKCHRKEIMFLLEKVDIGVGEFYELSEILFGGTGYEILASGKPLIQGFNFSKSRFSEIYNIPIPPLLDVKLEEDVYMHLNEMALNIKKRNTIGFESKRWFDEYCGIGLAKKWVQLLN
jgi:hypothetical protein